MSKYLELRRNPVKNTIIGTPKKVLLSMVSCMCDNRNQIVIECNQDGKWGLNTGGSAFSNFQMEYTRNDIIWEVEDGNWSEVIKMINSGTSLIESIKFK